MTDHLKKREDEVQTRIRNELSLGLQTSVFTTTETHKAPAERMKSFEDLAKNVDPM